MHRLRTCLLTGGALWELLRYEVLIRTGGFSRVRRSMVKPVRGRLLAIHGTEAEVCQAMDWAQCLYWKPVLCLQRSVATARLLRKQRLDAQVVVGCRPEPFFSHAWVEIGGRVVNDSPLYKVRLPALLQF